jgi:putative Mn2+ efflux pump MntP
MNFDVRMPIGLMFTAFGVILTGFGLVSGQEIYRRSLGVNVNLWWGVVLLGFGLTMLWLALRARSAAGSGPGNRPRGG